MNYQQMRQQILTHYNYMLSEEEIRDIIFRQILNHAQICTDKPRSKEVSQPINILSISSI